MAQNMFCDAMGTVHDLVLNRTYPDAMPLVERPLSPPLRLLLRPASLHELMAGLFWVDALRERGLPAPHLTLPCFPGARQDRLNPEGDALFTAKSIARLVNDRGFPSVTIIDPHSDVVPALLDRCRVVAAADCINPPAGKYAAVISPDAGAEKRAGAVAKKLGIPLVHAWKTRDVATGKIAGFGLQPCEGLRGSLVLVVDDICDGGGTFLGLAGKLNEAGLAAHLWTTHGIYSQGTEALLRSYGHLYCSDSYDGRRDGVIVANVCERLLKEGTL